MLSKEVMIEDWVFAPDNNKNKPSKPKKVLAIDFTTNHILVYNPKTEETTYADLADCGPIPLTKKILKLNEFSGDRIMEYRFEENHETYNLYLKEMYNQEGIQDSWGTNVGGVLPSVIMYVHEVQHLLRLAGLSKLADNFKI